MSMDLERWLGIPDVTDFLARVEERLGALLECGHSPIELASRRVALGGGKRLRPAFVYAFGSPMADDESRLVNAATAVELLQVGSLVHDDLFERSSVRRGVPTINVTEGEPQSILIGDYILARAGEAASIAGANVAACVARTCEQLCVGQVEEAVTGFDLGRSLDDCLRSIDLKTGALYRCSTELGGIVAGLGDDALHDATEFGRLFGIAFQLVDDVLDLIGDPTKMGKPVGVDMPAGVFSYPVVQALRSHRTGALRSALDRHDWEAAADAVRQSGSIEATLSRAREVAGEAAYRVPDRGALSRFPSRYVDWAVRELTAA